MPLQQQAPPTNWAAYFPGAGFITGGVWSGSDPALKDNVNDLENALDLIAQLEPKTYTFRTSDHPQLVLPDGVQRGLLSTNVEAVLPDLVREVYHPAEYDSLGNVVHPALTFQAVNYDGLVPILLAGMQEQQAQIQQLQQDLATCCTLDDTGLGTRSDTYDGITNTTSLENDRLTIAPNPFQERTTLSYLLEAPARVRLQVHTESGMHLATLRDPPQEPGSYSMTWDTQDLAPGLYYVTLFADGKPVVKKAVKVR